MRILAVYCHPLPTSYAAALRDAALAALQQVAEQCGNLFAELMSAVKVASLGQISGALYEVGGIYRRNM